MIHKAMEEFYVFVSSEDSLEHFGDNSGGQFRVQFPQFFVQDADGLENRLVRISDVRIISHEIPAYVNSGKYQYLGLRCCSNLTITVSYATITVSIMIIDSSFVLYSVTNKTKDI
jgi:hypothetical protein